MFENLTEKLSSAVKVMRGHARLTEDNIKEGLRDVRIALLEADVALPVIRAFIDRVREQAIGQKVLTSLAPGQALVKVVHDELARTMGEVNEGLMLKQAPPAVVLMAGLQGVGKTTTAAKLALFIREKMNKRVMLASADIYRPAAIDQLETLAGQSGALFWRGQEAQQAVELANHALQAARRQGADVLILDSAGRLHVDQDMMTEIAAIHEAVKPIETLFVVDSMMGQDAVNAAHAFGDVLPLTGVILTKADGDARGGAALSVRHVTGKPIKFIGMGEKIDALEPFYPDRIADRILGMGDVLTLVEEVQNKVDRDKTEKLVKKLHKGKAFSMVDLREQMLQMQSMGGVGALMDKLPGFSALPEAAKAQVNDKKATHMVAIIDSMTPAERRRPQMINGSRRRRIAAGSGTTVQEVNRLMKQFTQMGKMMKKFSKGGLGRLLQGVKGGSPGGGMPF